MECLRSHTTCQCRLSPGENSPHHDSLQMLTPRYTTCRPHVLTHQGSTPSPPCNLSDTADQTESLVAGQTRAKQDSMCAGWCMSFCRDGSSLNQATISVCEKQRNSVARSPLSHTDCSVPACGCGRCQHGGWFGLCLCCCCLSDPLPHSLPPVSARCIPSNRSWWPISSGNR